MYYVQPITGHNYCTKLSWDQTKDLLHYCCLCRWLSSLHSFHWGRSDTAGSRSVCPTPCRAKRPRTAASLYGRKHTGYSQLFLNKSSWENVCLSSLIPLYLQTVCRPVWCHIRLLPAAHRELAPGIVANTWAEKGRKVKTFIKYAKKEALYVGKQKQN